LFGEQRPGRLQVIGRLEPGKSLKYAEAALSAWSRQRTAEFPADRRATGIRLRSKATAIPLTSELLALFSPLAAAFALVLVLACTNVANMMLARTLARQREIGIRLSLGADRKRLIRQLLTESILLSIPSAILAFAVAQLAMDGAIRLMFATVPSDVVEILPDVTLPVDWRVVAFAVGAALVSALLFGLAPALQATRANFVAAARGEFVSDVRPLRVRNGLVIVQITVCTLLLVACGALVRTTLRMSTFDIGFRTGGIIAVRITQSERSWLVAVLASDPGVDAITAASSIPLGGPVPEVNATARGGLAINTGANHVSPAYFEMLGIPIIRGRNFTTEEAGSEAPVALISAATAQRLFPHADPLGETIHVTAKSERDVRVIGVVADIVTCCVPYGKDGALLYLPARESATGAVLVRVRGAVESEKRRLDALLATRAPGAVSELHSLDQYRAYGLYPFRAASMIAIAVGGLALLLTLSGIYGVVSFVVTQRTKEIGVRVALGATAGSVTRLVLKQSLRLAAMGGSVGLALAFGLSRMLASQMIFMQVFDVAAFGTGVSAVVVTAVIAGYVPSRRAARIDPLETLRYD
jgi:predicted permease